MLLSVFPLTASAYSYEQATLTFTDSGVSETVSCSGYTISGTTLTITEAGTYRITGSCAEGNIVVGKGLTGVTLVLDSLSLTSSETAPIVVKKTSSVLIKLVGESTLTNSEDSAKETTDPDNFEGAAVKVKSGSSLTIFGDGTLNALGNAKNAIKGAAETSLTVDGGTIKAEAVNNGIAFDGSIVINAGTFDVVSGNDAIKSQPDEGDTASAGTVTINGGTFNIDSQGDGIVAAEKFTINNGDFTIKTLDGSKSSSFNKNTMSCKGLKSSSNNVADADNPTTEINISGGTFSLDTADDAIHSDGYVTITGGTFDINTGDDGVHADATLTLGTENGYERDPEITINSSYEGLEGAVINAYSGKYYIIASDDGVNAAGGSSNGTDNGQAQDPFRPGGNRPGQGGFNPGGFNPGGQNTSGDYSINIYGGSFYVDCQGDGLDSNGALNLLGGDITVLSMRGGGDNSPLDADGTITINGASVFAAGSRGMGVNLSAASPKAYTSTSSYSAGTVINIVSSGKTLRSEKLVRNISYLLYTEPNLGSCSVSTASNVEKCSSNAFAHSWDNGTVVKAASESEAGSIKYTCSDCGAVEYKTIAKSAAVTSYTEDATEYSETTASETTESDVSQDAYTASFVTDSGATVNIYYKQDYTTPNETNVMAASARSSSTGEVDVSGDGQVNFAVVLADGCEIDSVTADGNYKNLKNLGNNIYRLTKITGDVTVTITTKASETTSTETVTETEPATDASETETVTETETETLTETVTSTDSSETETITETETVTETVTSTDASETETTTETSETVTEAEQTASETESAAATEAATEATTSGVGSGSDYKTADSIITKSKTEEPAGAEFSLLKARATKITKNTVTLKWNKVSRAVKYVIYANKCGTSNKFKKLTTVSGSKTSYKVTKAAGKKLKKGTYYKFIIVAVDKNGKVISTAKTIHVTTKGGKNGNYKGVTTAAKNDKVSLKKGATFKLKAKAVAQSAKLTVKQHRSLRYESSNKKIATVNSKGKITAKKKGTCYIYVYAQSGAFKKIKVTVS